MGKNKMELQLSSFQEEALGKLNSLKDQGVNLSKVETRGTAETYLRFTVSKSSVVLDLFLYEDEAGYFLDGRWRILEEQDFAGGADLLLALELELTEVLRLSCKTEGTPQAIGTTMGPDREGPMF